MTTRVTHVFISILFLSAVCMSIYSFPLLPQTIASHWNVAGEANGYMDRFWGVALMPLILVVLWIFLAILPIVDPLKMNIEEFRGDYNSAIASILLFFFYMHALLLRWNLGERFSMGSAISLGIGVLFIIIGSILPRTKRNWFLGIRTPWTLSSDRVWKKTHWLGGKLFVLTGVVIMATGAFIPASTFYVLISSVLLTVVTVTAMSYRYFKRE